MMEEKMVRRGARAMERSLKSMRKVRDMFCRYTSNYRYLASIGDKGMAKAWREANKIRENWMKPERLHIVPEEEEPQDEQPPEPPDETPEPPDEALEEATAEIPGEEIKPGDQGQEDEGQGVQKPQGPPKGQVRKLTDYFNKIGGPTTPKAPKTVQRTAVTPRTPGNKKTPGAGGISKPKKKKGKIKMEEPQRAKLELAMRTFLQKKPPETP